MAGTDSTRREEFPDRDLYICFDFLPTTLPLKLPANAAARTDEAQRAAAERARAFLPFLEGWQPLIRLQAVLHVVVHVGPCALDHHAGSTPPRRGRPAAIPRDSVAPHPVAEREAAFARTDRGSPITARRSALHDGVQQPLTSNGSVKLAVDRLPRVRPRRVKRRRSLILSTTMLLCPSPRRVNQFILPPARKKRRVEAAHPSAITRIQ